MVWTINQTSGRGQRQNKWYSDFKDSLTFSIFRQFKDIEISNPFLISLIVSLGIYKALTELRIPNLNIKWPNDILSENKKIGGILIENFFTKGKLIASVIGVGLNLNQLSFQNIPNAKKKKRNAIAFFFNVLYVLHVTFAKHLKKQNTNKQRHCLKSMIFNNFTGSFKFF